MKVKKLFFLVLLFLWSGQIAMSQQPYAPCWHPLNLKGWNPSMDPDFQFNKATIKLQPRFQNINLNANPYQHYEGQLCAMITMNDAWAARLHLKMLSISSAATPHSGNTSIYWFGGEALPAKVSSYLPQPRQSMSPT